MTLREKLRIVETDHPEIYLVLEVVVPDLLKNPEFPSAKDLNEYNFWIDGILDFVKAQPLYHYK